MSILSGRLDLLSIRPWKNECSFLKQDENAPGYRDFSAVANLSQVQYDLYNSIEPKPKSKYTDLLEDFNMCLKFSIQIL